MQVVILYALSMTRKDLEISVLLLRHDEFRSQHADFSIPNEEMRNLFDAINHNNQKRRIRLYEINSTRRRESSRNYKNIVNQGSSGSLKDCKTH